MKNAKISKLAVCSLIFSMGIISIIFVKRSSFSLYFGFVAVLIAIICGHFARAKIRKNPLIFGYKLALTGLIISYINLVLLIIALIGISFLEYRFANGYRKNDLKTITIIVNQYVEDNEGKFPENLEIIVKKYNMHPKLLISPVTKDRSKPSYKLVLKGNIADYSDKSNTVMITEVTPNKRGNKLVVYLDGRVELISDDKKTTNIYSRSTGSIQPKK